MKILSYEKMKALYLKHDNVKKIIDMGFTSTMAISTPKLINDGKVINNSFLVNNNFEKKPECFSAFYTDRIYKVIRCIYVDVPSRRKGLAKKMISEFQKKIDLGHEVFLQVGVEYTESTNYSNLEKLYTSQGFIRTKTPTRHPGDKFFHDFFWSSKSFEVVQNNGLVIPIIK